MKQYFSLMFTLPVIGEIIPDFEKDNSAIEKLQLDKTNELEQNGIDWRHQYFKGGPDYFVYVCIDDEVPGYTEKLQHLKQAGELYLMEHTDPDYRWEDCLTRFSRPRQ